MTTVIIRNNPIDRDSDRVFKNVGSVLNCLFDEFDKWPKTAKVYLDYISEETEIELKEPEDLARLDNHRGTVYVVVYPALMAVVGVALIAATAAIMFTGKKEKSTSSAKADQRKIPEGSPNNSLSDRSNRERINQRIPDIYGTVRAVPDLIASTYRVYKNNVEMEYAYMVLGRGKYHVEDIREDKTLLTQIGGTSSLVYGPFKSPNNSEPDYQVGGEITEPLLYTSRSSAVANDALLAPGEGVSEHDFSGTEEDNFWFTLGGRYNSPGSDPQGLEWNVITIPSHWPHTFIGHFNMGDRIHISGEIYVGSKNTILNITTGAIPYVVDKVESKRLFLANPASANSVWNTIKTWYKEGVIFGQNVLTFQNVTSEGGAQYIIEDAKQVIVNVSCDGGLWTDDGIEQTAKTVQLQLAVQRVDASDNPIGSPAISNFNITGSATNRDKVGLTHRYNTPWEASRLQVSLRRITPLTENTNELRSNEEIRWDDLYGAKVISEDHFGDVTTIRTVTRANNAASAVKERKLNCRASRLIPKRLEDGTFTEPTVTSRFADIAVAISLDPLIGNRSIEELDIDNFYAVQDEIEAYFGTPVAGEFNHTFDDDNLSYEETLSIIAECAHSRVYRQGSVIKFSFERETNNSLILFNHRNKLPNSEKRTVSFGYLNDKDGVELEYIDPDDGALVKYYIPEDRTAINPESIRQYGVQNKLQAYFLAKRIWNRIQYQNTAVEFDATQEASLLVINDRVQISDNTRTNTFDGEIVSQDGSVLTLSQPFIFEEGKSYVVFLQNVDATIQSIPIAPGNSQYEIVLQQQPNLPLALDLDLYARTTYEIVEVTSPRKRAFLIDEKTPKDNFTTTIKAVNYDSRYYQNDKDLINGIVNNNGDMI